MSTTDALRQSVPNGARTKREVISTVLSIRHSLPGDLRTWQVPSGREPHVRWPTSTVRSTFAHVGLIVPAHSVQAMTVSLQEALMRNVTTGTLLHLTQEQLHEPVVMRRISKLDVDDTAGGVLRRDATAVVESPAFEMVVAVQHVAADAGAEFELGVEWVVKFPQPVELGTVLLVAVAGAGGDVRFVAGWEVHPVVDGDGVGDGGQTVRLVRRLGRVRGAALKRIQHEPMGIRRRREKRGRGYEGDEEKEMEEN